MEEDDMMWTIRLANGVKVAYLQDGDAITGSMPDYCIYYVKSEDFEKIAELRKHNYCFADRLMLVEIPLASWNPNFYSTDKGRFQYEVAEHWTQEEVYDLAKDNFYTDRRFAVSFKQPDEARKQELLYQYIGQLKECGYYASLCYKDARLVGFTLWNVHNSEGTILLGAVAQKYRSLGVAICMYEFTLLQMKGREGARVLSSRVSTSNLSAVKMYLALARGKKPFKITGFEDQYIKEENK